MAGVKPLLGYYVTVNTKITRTLLLRVLKDLRAMARLFVYLYEESPKSFRSLPDLLVGLQRTALLKA